jgi:hypothetical protein
MRQRLPIAHGLNMSRVNMSINVNPSVEKPPPPLVRQRRERSLRRDANATSHLPAHVTSAKAPQPQLSPMISPSLAAPRLAQLRKNTPPPVADEDDGLAELLDVLEDDAPVISTPPPPSKRKGYGSRARKGRGLLGADGPDISMGGVEMRRSPFAASERTVADGIELVADFYLPHGEEMYRVEGGGGAHAESMARKLL